MVCLISLVCCIPVVIQTVLPEAQPTACEKQCNAAADPWRRSWAAVDQDVGLLVSIESRTCEEGNQSDAGQQVGERKR